MLKQIIFSFIGLLVLISSAQAMSSLTIGTPSFSSSVLKDESFTVEASLEAASVDSTITVTVILTDSTSGVTITSAVKTISYSSAGTQNIQWSVKANNPGTYSNPFTITATANDGGTASPKTATTSLVIKDRPVLTANVTQNATSVPANGYVMLNYTIANVASPEAASATDINASLSALPGGWDVITPSNYSISSLSAGGEQTSGYFIVKAPSTSTNASLNMSIVSAQGDSIAKSWSLEVTSQAGSGNINVTLADDTGVSGSTVNMNFTINDTSNSTSWFNFTFPGSFNIVGAVLDYIINGVSLASGWNTTNGSNFINLSSGTTFAYSGNTSYFNFSNITITGGAISTYINVRTNNSGDIPVNYTVGTYGVNLTNVSALTGSVNVGANVTYVFTLQNNGTLSDSYNLTISNPYTVNATLNVTGNISLAPNAVQILSLNVSYGSAGTFPVNVTATSINYSNRTASINTTTIVMHPMSQPGGPGGSGIACLSINSSIAGGSVTMNFMVNDSTNPTSWYNITFPDGFDASNSSLNLKINGSDNPVNWTNITSTRYVNISSNNASITANSNVTQFINLSNVIVSSTAGNYSINLSTSNEITIPFNYTINEYGSNLTNISVLSKNTNTSANATYILNLTNNGTAADSYNLTYTNPDGATVVGFNISNISIPLASGASRVFTLNVSNTSGGTFRVNVTATSTSDSRKVSSVNTITTVINATGSVNGTVSDARFNTLLSDVRVTLRNATGGIYENTTDSNGYYYIQNIVTDIGSGLNYSVSASRTNYMISASYTVSVLNQTGNTTHNINLTAYNGSVTGTVLKKDTRIEIGGATVNITNATLGESIIVNTRNDGKYRVESLYPAVYTINVTRTGYSGNSTSATVASNNTKTVSAIRLSPNTVTVTANRTVGSAESGQNVSFNLTVVNTGDEANFTLRTAQAVDIGTIVTIDDLTMLLDNTTPKYVVVKIKNSNVGSWPVTILFYNSSKSASVTLTAIMKNSTVNYTNYSSFVIDYASVSGGAILKNTTVQNATVIGANLENTTVRNGASVSGNNTSITNATVTGENTRITDGAVIRGDYGNSSIDNSSVGNATVVSSNLTSSTTVRSNSSVTNSTLAGAIVDNSTLTNVTVTGTSTISNVANLTNIDLGGVTVVGDPGYDYEGRISAGTGWVITQGINFTTVYTQIRISQLILEKSPDQDVTANVTRYINDTSLGTSMNFAMIINLSSPAWINISETGINPGGAAITSGTLIGNFLNIFSNDTSDSNVTNHTLRLYYDIALSTYSGGVKMYYYNTSIRAWEELGPPASGTENNRSYIEVANINHFSTFALAGITTTGTNTGSSSGGGGGGGGGGKSGENVSNIEVIEKYDMQISKDVLTSYRFTHAKNPIMFVNITGNTSLGVITASVEALKNTSTLVKVPPEGLVYKNANIWVGTAGFATPKNIKEALIKFRVNNEWMSTNGVSASDIVLVKWDRTNWIKLETKVLSKDDINTYFEGKTNSFSPFAIAAKTKAAAKPSVTATAQAGTIEITETATSAATKKTPGFGIALALLGLMAAVLRKRSW